MSPIDLAPRNRDGIPIKLFLTEELTPDQETIEQLENLAGAPGLTQHVAVLPDIHRKGRNPSPTGTAVASKEVLLPRAVDTGINCGIRMLTSDIDSRHVDISTMDEIFGELTRSIPVAFHDNDVLSEDDFRMILAEGGKWSQRRFGISDQELDRIEDRATTFFDTRDADTIMASMPERALKKGKRCFATIGDGNHFLEMQEVVELIEPDIARQLGIEQGKIFVMLHTGSRSVGSKMMKSFLKLWEEKYRNAASHRSQSSIWSIPLESEDGLRYARALAAASNYGFANRIAITEALRASVRNALGDAALELPLLFDCAHVSIKQEQWNGSPLWIHRHGASRAFPPSKFPQGSVFAKTGQPVPIPGSMGHDSYIGVVQENAKEAFFSVNHGAGRSMDKPDAAAVFSEQQIEQEMQQRNIRLYRYNSDNIAEQAPGSFKNISSVINAMQQLSLARPVARLRPLAVLKG